MEFTRFTGEGRIEVCRGPSPKPAPGEVRLRVLACALCGSDLRPWRLGWPVTPGHEVVAEVAQPGHRLHGQRVAVYIPIWCGHCDPCLAGHTQLCEAAPDIQLIGWQRPGGYAQAMVAPEQCLIPLPDDIPTELAPLLLDTIGTAGHGVRLARRLVPSGAALVVGAGPIGLGALVVLQESGYGPIYVSEPAVHRRRFAEQLGAISVTPGEVMRRYPLVLETSGKDAGRQFALESVAPLGVVVQLGEAERWNVQETRRLRLKDFFYLRSFYFPLCEFDDNLRILRARLSTFNLFVDETATLQELQALFMAFSQGERIKPVVRPNLA